MNLRQKAKKYKKEAERYKNKANAWDTYLRYSNHFYSAFPSRGYGTIETFKVAKMWDDRVPVDEDYFKKEMAMELAECLLREGYIDFKVESEYSQYNLNKLMIATLKVTQGGWNDEDCY